jgi:Flp pilus assembly protein TadD
MSQPPERDDSENSGISPELIQKLDAGEISVAELLGVSPELQYEIANIGYRMLTQGQLDNALKVYEALVALSPKDATFHCHLAATLYALERPEEAFVEYNCALGLNAKDVDALVGRGELHVRDGRSAEGLADLKKALALDPQGAHVSTARARATVTALEHSTAKKRTDG